MTEDTQQAIAEDLGVSKGTVQNAKDELREEGVNLFKVERLNTDEKREQVRELVEDSIHIIRSNTLNIPSEREQKRDAVRSYIEDNSAKFCRKDAPPGRFRKILRKRVAPTGGRFHRFYSVLLTDIQRGEVRPGAPPRSGGSPVKQSKIQGGVRTDCSQ